MPDLLKIGFSTKEPTERADKLFTTGVPSPFEVAYSCAVENPAKIEKRVHRNLSRYRHRKDREFFKCDTSVAIKALERVKVDDEQSKVKAAVAVKPDDDSYLYNEQYCGVYIYSRDNSEYEKKSMRDFVKEITSYVDYDCFIKLVNCDSQIGWYFIEMDNRIKLDNPLAQSIISYARNHFDLLNLNGEDVTDYESFEYDEEEIN